MQKQVHFSTAAYATKMQCLGKKSSAMLGKTLDIVSLLANKVDNFNSLETITMDPPPHTTSLLNVTLIVIKTKMS